MGLQVVIDFRVNAKKKNLKKLSCANENEEKNSPKMAANYFLLWVCLRFIYFVEIENFLLKML